MIRNVLHCVSVAQFTYCKGFTAASWLGECSGNIERCSRVFWMLLKVCRRAGLREQDIELAHVLVPVPSLQREEDFVAADLVVAVPVRDAEEPLELLVRHGRPTAALGRPAFTSQTLKRIPHTQVNSEHFFFFPPGATWSELRWPATEKHKAGEQHVDRHQASEAPDPPRAMSVASKSRISERG